MKVKKMAIVYLVIIFVFVLSSISCVKGIDTNYFEPDEPTVSDVGDAIPLVEKIIGAITTIGIIISILSIIMIGIKYMTGSIEEKAEYKKAMIPYLIGCLFIFSISTIISIIYNLVSKL